MKNKDAVIFEEWWDKQDNEPLLPTVSWRTYEYYKKLTKEAFKAGITVGYMQKAYEKCNYPGESMSNTFSIKADKTTNPLSNQTP